MNRSVRKWLYIYVRPLGGGNLLDSLWVKRILLGDKRAGERFVREHYPRIYRLLHHLTGRAEVAEDLTQQTFVKAWQGMEKFKNRSLLITWLSKIAYHEYTHWLRSRQEHVHLETLAEMPAPEQELSWATYTLPRALSQLSEEHRETFLLYHVHELSVAEVAKVLEIAPGTVKSRLFVARQRLRELLQPQDALLTDEFETPAEAKAILVNGGGGSR